MEKILAWKILPRLMMLVMTCMFIRVVEWYMSIPQDEVTTQATIFTSTIASTMTGSFAVWLNSER